MSAVSKVLSGPPFRAQLFGLDLNGDGTINDLLPGTGWNELGRGVDAAGLREIVERFNSTVAGGLTPAGRPIPRVTLPSSFRFGDSVFSQDLRVAKIFRFSDRYELNVFGEVFNLFNVANLDGYGVNLLEPVNVRAAQSPSDAGVRFWRAEGIPVRRQGRILVVAA